MVASIKRAVKDAGRHIPDDHYGAGFSYRFGSWDEPEVERAASDFGRLRATTRPDPRELFAVGDAGYILARIDEYRAAGVPKFVLRPIAEGQSGGFVMRHPRRLSIREISERTQRSSDSIRSSLYRVKRILMETAEQTAALAP